jgi:hypothetical protein
MLRLCLWTADPQGFAVKLSFRSHCLSAALLSGPQDRGSIIAFNAGEIPARRIGRKNKLMHVYKKVPKAY